MFGFIIAGCILEEVHLTSIRKCLDSIQTFNPNNKIVVIIAFTSNKDFVNTLVKEYPDVLFETDTEPYPADMQLLKYFKEKKYFDTAILLQDSMYIKKEFNIENVDNIKYIWHFNNHRLHWHTIKESETEYNKQHNIITHDDLIHDTINNLPENEFSKYCKDTYPKKDLWSGCFGCICIITYDFLEKLDSKTNIINIKKQMTTNRFFLLHVHLQQIHI